VQRLDPEPDAQPLRLRDEVADRVGDHAPGQAEIPAAGDQAAADQDQRVGAEFGCLGQGGQVVRPRRLPSVGVGPGEEPAPAQAGHVQSGAADRGRRRGQACFCHPVAPQPDRRDVVPHAQCRGFVQPEVPDRRLVQ